MLTCKVEGLRKLLAIDAKLGGGTAGILQLVITLTADARRRIHPDANRRSRFQFSPGIDGMQGIAVNNQSLVTGQDCDILARKTGGGKRDV